MTGYVLNTVYFSFVNHQSNAIVYYTNLTLYSKHWIGRSRGQKIGSVEF